MERYSIDPADRLSDLVDAALRGEEAVLVRDGVVVAEIMPFPGSDISGTMRPIDLKALEALRARLPLSSGSGANLVRSLRDETDE